MKPLALRRGIAHAAVCLIYLIVACAAQIAWAGGHSTLGGRVGRSAHSTVHVRGYSRSNGTYVHAYDRAAPGTSIHTTSSARVLNMSTVPKAVPIFPKAIPVAPKAIPVVPAATASLGVQRDANGQIKRSESAKRDFMRQTGYPNGRPGYVVDHIIPLKRGGCDCPSNMQWETIQEAKAKDKWE
jgi:hypothetical protein